MVRARRSPPPPAAKRAVAATGAPSALRPKALGAMSVFAVRRGRVRAVGVATRALARRPARLRAAMRRLRKARATQAARTFTPNPTAGSARLTGTTLAGSSNPRLNRALALLCSVKP
jgi:hypothetical protein